MASPGESRWVWVISSDSAPRQALRISPGQSDMRMLDEYQLLAREQLICGTHVHVGVPERAAAAIIAERVAPWLHQLLAISASLKRVFW